MLSPHTILQDRYHIVQLLGQGGMGAVYEAIDQRVSCLVALKETLVRSDTEAGRAFEREAALLANLRHPSLPKVTDYFSEGQGEFLVMEFIPGLDLAELLELRGSPFPQDQVLRWGHQLLTVLDYLHSRNPPILHRDIKPSNLKLTRQGEIFLLDFGLAKGAAGQMPTLKAIKSVHGYTRGFASLEQILGQGTDERSDLFSLGATLYYLLTNTVPPDAPTRSEAREDGEDDPLGLIESLNPQVSPHITAVIHQAMAMNRRQRPTSARDMQQALRLAGEEDERQAVEEEYRRVEARRQQQEEEVRRRGEEERRLQQAETRRREEEARHQREALERQQQHEEAVRRAEEEQRQRSIEAERRRSKVPETSPSHELRTVGGQVLGLFRDRRVVLAIAIVAIMAAGFLILLMLYGSANPNPPVNNQKGSDNETAQPLPPEGMVYVPGGTFMMGRDDGDEYERPSHKVTVKPFFIDIYEVTNEGYLNFVQAAGHQPPSIWIPRFDEWLKAGKPKVSYPTGTAHRPVTGVTWDDAIAYARWAGKRLPTEEEWEFAARGADGRRYPWGNDWRNGLANANGASNGMVNIEECKDKSPYGALGMVGNAWEWTASRLIPYPGGILPVKVSGNPKVIRGGTYSSDQTQATTTYRRGWLARGESDYSNTGFRCVKDIAN